MKTKKWKKRRRRKRESWEDEEQGIEGQGDEAQDV